jgi:membrane protein YdbS with pleckstrin-like domain
MPDAPDGVLGALPPEPDQRLSRQALTAWMVAGAGRGLVAIVAVSWVLGRRGDVWGGLAIAVACAYAVLSAVVVPLLRHRSWRYAVREEEIDLRHGAWVLRRTIIPMVRVQHVDTARTPLGQVFGIASLTIHTAAGGHAVPGLALATADRLRTEIARRAREPDDV